jgi:hypothetical protein
MRGQGFPVYTDCIIIVMQKKGHGKMYRTPLIPPPDGKGYFPTVSHFLFDLNASIAYNPHKDKPQRCGRTVKYTSGKKRKT